MMKQHNKYDEDFIQHLREFYMGHDISLEYMAENSMELFNRNVPLADLKALSRTDVLGPWSVLKANNGRKTEDVPMAEKIMNVANKLYEQMFNSDEQLSPTQLAQTAKTWSDLIDKTKISREGTSAKLPVQQVKDMIEQEQAKNK